MMTNFLELATTLKYLGAKWLPEKKLILRPGLRWFHCEPFMGSWLMYDDLTNITSIAGQLILLINVVGIMSFLGAL